jgi:hypothetical protein
LQEWWEIVINATCDLPSFCIYGDSLSDVLTNFKKYIDIDTISKFRQAVNKAAENNKVENNKIKKLLGGSDMVMLFKFEKLVKGKVKFLMK